MTHCLQQGNNKLPTFSIKSDVTLLPSPGDWLTSRCVSCLEDGRIVATERWMILVWILSFGVRMVQPNDSCLSWISAVSIFLFHFGSKRRITSDNDYEMSASLSVHSRTVNIQLGIPGLSSLLALSLLSQLLETSLTGKPRTDSRLPGFLFIFCYRTYCGLLAADNSPAVGVLWWMLPSSSSSVWHDRSCWVALNWTLTVLVARSERAVQGMNYEAPRCGLSAAGCDPSPAQPEDWIPFSFHFIESDIMFALAVSCSGGGHLFKTASGCWRW